MKAKYQLLAAGFLMLCFFACKTEPDSSETVNVPNIIGKWYEKKLIIQQQNLKTGAAVDTTYLSDNFNELDYFQFNRDSTAVISFDGTDFGIEGKNYYSNGPGNPPGGQGHYRLYSVKDSTLTLQLGNVPVCSGCSQPATIHKIILQLDADNLVLKAPGPDTSVTYKVITVTYYTKQL